MELSKLTRQREIGVRAIIGSQNVDLSDPQYDSRSVKQGSTFFAIKGFTQDGHTFIAKAVELGASAIVLEDESYVDSSLVVTWIVVESSRKALAYISEELLGSPSQAMRLIGVTGTNGKTTTTNLIKQLLSQRGERVGLIGTLGVWIGERFIETAHTTPESRNLSALMAQMVAEGITTCVMEVSSHAVALDRVAALDFDIAIFTNITQDHLDFHKTFDEYAKAKQQFFSSLKPTAVAITNADDAYGNFMVEESEANVHSYSINNNTKTPTADIMADVVSMTLSGSTFIARKRFNDEHIEITSPLVGMFNVANVMAAAAGLHYGAPDFSFPVLAEAIRTLAPVRGRFEQITLPVGAIAVIDYAHTPDALDNLIKAAKTVDKDLKHIITVFGCGGDRDRTKRPLMGKIAAEGSNVTVVTSDNPRTEDPQTIISDIIAGVPKEKLATTTVQADRRKAIESALGLAQKNDVVLIAGKGHEDYQIIGKTKFPFDDKQIVLEWINKHV